MSRLAIPVIGQRLYATGDVTLRADVTLALRDDAGYFVPWLFRIDSATDVTTFPAFEASGSEPLGKAGVYSADFIRQRS